MWVNIFCYNGRFSFENWKQMAGVYRGTGTRLEDMVSEQQEHFEDSALATTVKLL